MVVSKEGERQHDSVGLELWILIWSPGFESLSDLSLGNRPHRCFVDSSRNEREEGTRDENLRTSAWEATS